jgi:hypothetical protein
MSEYSKAQSTVVALWVLALSKFSIGRTTAPDIITEIVNQLGDAHSSDSVLLHKHGYDRLLLGRKIDKTMTALQRQVAQELREAGIMSEVYNS